MRGMEDLLSFGQGAWRLKFKEVLLALPWPISLPSNLFLHLIYLLSQSTS